jgi:hypothetical protein
VSPGCSKRTDHPQDVVRIGYQKTGTLNLVRLRGTLAPDLALLGVRAEAGRKNKLSKIPLSVC